MVGAKTTPPILTTLTIFTSRTFPLDASLPSSVRNRLHRESLFRLKSENHAAVMAVLSFCRVDNPNAIRT
jgi:hypothetical protein